ncbi:ABC transporter permease [Lewinella sp. 4G2]|uniref:ABC transporter permease n=1 Tax=Lewinella sp. 4G2 TaxID=1803372 RepID=UPI0007B463E2|nr:ABC transporter permease [Lewinella sp. 4G2]OAV42671.1 hypothetical protein A3850_015625 [Lewinella sp. 4G2]
MFKNYLLLSLKVLKRKPFYTFVSLFGISFTLMILMLIASLYDASLGDNKPLSERDRLVVVPYIERFTMNYDTITTIDTIQVEGDAVRYDTTQTLEETNSKYMSSGPMSYRFAYDNLKDLESVENQAFFSSGNFIEGYLEGRKFSFQTYYVSDQYFNVFDFDFLHGSPLNADDERGANKAVVITDKTSLTYFGSVDASVVGQEMNLGGETYTVRGVVRRPISDSGLFAGDVYAPITTIDNRQLAETSPQGGFVAVFLASTPEKREAIKAELDFLGENYQLPPDDPFRSLKIHSATFFERFARNLIGADDNTTAVRLLFIPLAILLLLFVALPLLNLVNLNIGRVNEREGEIGVRKAFGASSTDILYQFIFENMVLTVIGGIVGMALALMAISYINANDLLGTARLSYSTSVFLYFLLIILLFGFLSGILPAYRMSRANVAESLR